MKLLHTSDWHLGRTTRNVSRAPDHESVLAEIIDIAQRTRPDLILHTGDLFDMVRPAYESMQLGMQALQELAAVAPVVVLCGNHDSPLLFRLFNQVLGHGHESLARLRPLLEKDVPRITFVDRARLPEEGGILDFDTAKGERLRLASIPFVHANRMIDAFEKDPSAWTAAYADRIRRLEDVLARGLQQGYDASRDILLFAGHLHVGGVRFSTSERALHVSDAYATRAEHIPPVTYAAFGHIHRPQPLPGAGPSGRYAGSPIQLDFGELGEEKSVVFVAAKPGDAPEITTLPLSGGRPLRRFDGTLEELAALAPEIGQELCTFIIRTQRPAVDLADQVHDLVPRAVVLEVVESCAARVAETLVQGTSPDESEPDFADLLRQYLSENETKHHDPEHVRGLFTSLLDAARSEQVPELPVLRWLRDPSSVPVEEPHGAGLPGTAPDSPAGKISVGLGAQTDLVPQVPGSSERAAREGRSNPPPTKRKPATKRSVSGTQGSLLP